LAVTYLRQRALSLLLTVLFVPHAYAGVFNPQTATLTNGMEIVVISDHRTPVVTQMIWYRVGSADDPPGKSGLSHFLEHLMFKSTATARQHTFSQLVAYHGGHDNAFTGQDYTAYFQTVPSTQLEMVMQLEADRMNNLQFDVRDVELERKVILEERLGRTDNRPSALLREQVYGSLYVAHPYGIPTIGWAHEIEKITIHDVEDFYYRHYMPNNSVLVIAGDATMSQVLPLATTYYGDIPERALPRRQRLKDPPQRAHKRITLEHPLVSQPSWRRSYIAPSANYGVTEYALPLMLLSYILGGDTNSRLYQALAVDRKIASRISSYYGPNRLQHSLFSIFATPNRGISVLTIENGIDEVLNDLLAEGVTEAEVNRGKRILIAEATYARDDITNVAHIFGTALLTGSSVTDIESWPVRVSHITTDQVNEAASYILESYPVTGLLLPTVKGANE